MNSGGEKSQIIVEREDQRGAEKKSGAYREHKSNKIKEELK